MDEWQRFLTALDGPDGADDVQGIAFEELFQSSPSPTMSQDYSRLLDWFASLRARGVTDIEAYFDEHPDQLLEAVGRIVITAANPAACEVTGIPMDELVGPVDERIVNPEARVSWTAQMTMVWNGDRTAGLEFEGERGDGTAFDARLSAVAPCVSGHPDYTRVVLTIHDISEERARERSMAELVEAKTHFVASVSHELRTPLTGVLGFAELLSQESSELSPGDVEEFTRTLHRQAVEAANLVEDLLVAARTELGQLTVTRRIVDPRRVTQTVLDNLGYLNRQIEGPEQSDDTMQCFGDPGRIRQILRNLLTNAVRYGGEHIEVGIQRLPGGVGIEVRDNGDGIPADEVERAFEPYERATNAARSELSVGIGLSVSRDLANLMGGHLCYSRRGDWSVFELFLRQADETPSKVDCTAA